MGEFRTSSNYYGKGFYETLAGSGVYDEVSFIPTVFEFDINRDNPKQVSNISVLSLGTPMPVYDSDIPNRKFYASLNNLDVINSSAIFRDTGNITYGHGASPYICDTIPGRYLGGMFSNRSHTGSCYFGAYYNQDVEYAYIFYARESTVGEGYDPRYSVTYLDQTYWSDGKIEAAKQFVIDAFYGGTAPSKSNTVTLINPKNIYFNQGETKILEFGLKTTDGLIITDGISVNIERLDTSPYWTFNSETNELTFTSGTTLASFRVTITYDDVESVGLYTFRPYVSDAYNQGGQSTSGGGGGSYGGGTFGGGGQSTSDNISGSLPIGSTEVQDASTGLFTRYLCTPQFLNVLGEWLWTTDLGLAIAKAAISLFYSDPAESIISLMSFPFALSTMTGFNSVSQEFYWGNFGSGFQGTAVKSSAVQMDWGSLKIDEYWGNFLDYSPHTKVELYLPWSTGFVELDATQVVGRTISIKTNIDLNKGSCVHNVYDDLGSVIGSYSGQCGKQLPITASDFASKLASITTAAVGTAVAATVSAGSGIVNATGGEIIPFKIAGGDQGLMRQPREFNVESAKSTMQRTVKPAIASAAATALRPAHISRNGSFSDGSAGMGVQYPYIIVSRPTQSVPEEYGHHYGYPSNIYQRLQYLSGYTEIGEIHLTGIPCTDSELNELDRILKGGVLF